MHDNNILLLSDEAFPRFLAACAEKQREKNDDHHSCKCGGKGHCPDCPNKNH